MQKTLFAGLTVLDPDESVVEDNGAFIGRDRDTIDRYLEIGAKTHRHNGLSGLSDPIGAPSGAVIASGGTLPADTTYTFGYTLGDETQGETLLSPTATVSTPPVLDTPTDSIDAVLDYSGGNLPIDTYYYAISYMDAEGGETPIGPSTAAERQPGFANAQVLLSGLAAGVPTASAAGWRLYRAVGGGGFGYLASGVADTFTDSGSLSADTQITPIPDDLNTTLSVSQLEITLPADVGPASFINVYVSEDGDFSGSVFLDQFPAASAGNSLTYAELVLDDAQPPDVSTSIGGAHLIDPDTELLDWHWKRPVAHPYQLGSGVQGDVRVATATGRIYAMLAASGSGATAWTDLAGLGSAGVDVGDAFGDSVEAVAVRFVASGEAQVAVNESSPGTAEVTVYAPSAVTSQLNVTDADGPVVGGIAQLKFVASGSASVGVSDLGGGQAQVTVWAPSGAVGPTGPAGASGAPGGTGGTGPTGASGASGAPGPTGPTGPQGLPGSAANIYASAQGPRLGPVNEFDFAASGAAQVAMTDLGGGSAQVMIFASAMPGATGPTGPTGPTGASGAPGGTGPTGPQGIPGSAANIYASAQGPRLGPVKEFDFAASGAASVKTADLGGGSAQVTISSTDSAKSLMLTTGDIIVASGAGNPTNLPVAGSGQFLSTDPAAALGLRWHTLHFVGTHAQRLARTHRGGVLFKESDTGLTYLDDGVNWIIWNPTGLVLKTATETVNNSNTVQDDDELFFPIEPGEQWFVELYLDILGGSTAPDFQCDFTVTGGQAFESTLALSQIGVLGATSNAIAAFSGTATTTAPAAMSPLGGGATVSFGTNPTAQAVVIAGWIGTQVGVGGTGLAKFRWAQNTAVAIDTKVYKRSWMRPTRLV